MYIAARIRLYLLAKKDVKDLALSTLKRVAGDKDDPRHSQAQQVLETKYGIDKETGLTSKQQKNKESFDKAQSKVDSTSGKLEKSNEKLIRLKDNYNKALKNFKKTGSLQERLKALKTYYSLMQEKDNNSNLKDRLKQYKQDIKDKKQEYNISLKNRNVKPIN